MNTSFTFLPLFQVSLSPQKSLRFLLVILVIKPVLLPINVQAKS